MTTARRGIWLVTFVVLTATLLLEAHPTSAHDEKCIAECKQRHRDKIKICDDLVNSSGSVYYRDTVWHKQCLEEARTEFDNCLSLCQ